MEIKEMHYGEYKNNYAHCQTVPGSYDRKTKTIKVIMPGKKYELTEETKVVDGVTLHRIRAIRDIHFYGVKAGDLGGWVQSEANLSQDGDCWVVGRAVAMENAVVCNNAIISDYAIARDHAVIKNKAIVNTYAQIAGNAQIADQTQVGGFAKIHGDAKTEGFAIVTDDAVVAGTVRVNNCTVGGNAIVIGDQVITTSVYGTDKNAHLHGATIKTISMQEKYTKYTTYTAVDGSTDDKAQTVQIVERTCAQNRATAEATKSEIFAEAHRIARGLRDGGMDYKSAFSRALKEVYAVVRAAKECYNNYLQHKIA